MAVNSEDNSVRINKYLSEAGICSRRKADEEIANGFVKINDRIATTGDRVGADDEVYYKGKLVLMKDKLVIYAYNKPMGLVCTSKEADKDSIFNKTQFPTRVNYVGRLDKDSQGLLLLTNDGDLANNIQKARNNHEKEYVVRVDKPVTDEFIKGMRNGVPILDTVTKKCHVVKQSERTFRIILTQGLNRQIRRMCDYFDYRVVFLKRIRVLNVELGTLKPGEYRELTSEEDTAIRRLVNNK